MDKKIQLKDLLSEDSEFTLKNGNTIELRAATIEDFAWMQAKFGKKVSSALGDLENTAVVLYRLLKDKSPFPPQDITDYDDDGNKVTVKKTGPQMLAREMKGMADFSAAVEALGKAMGTKDVMEAVNEKIEEDLTSSDTEVVKKSP